MTRRTYVEVANSYAPFTQAVLQGLGEETQLQNGWPAGRSYIGIAHFRAPYDEFGYFQDGTLQGLGAVASNEMLAIDNRAPGAVKRFLLAGDPVSSLRADVTLPFNQIHPYVYGVLAVAAAATSYVSYKRWKKSHGT
jgi:hypothetical protein